MLPAVPLLCKLLIIPADQVNHYSVICELDDVIGAVSGRTVVGHQSKEQEVDHTAMGGHLYSVSWTGELFCPLHGLSVIFQ